MKTKKEKKPRGIVYKRAVPCGVMAVIMAAAGIGSAAAFKSADAINIALDTVPVSLKNEGGEDTQYFTMDFDSTEELKAHDAEIAQKLTEEGCVLLKNSRSALPLSAGSRVSVFSHSSVDLVTCGTGSGDIDTGGAQTSLKAALESAGVQVNPTLWEFYLSGDGSSYTRSPSKGSDTMPTAREKYSINEVPQSAYTEDVKNSYASWGDAAIVVLSRVGGEAYDLPSGSNEKDPCNGLELSQEEIDLLTALKQYKDAGVFKKIVVLLNTTNAMDCGFLEDDAYGIDAAMWVGYIGQYGADAVADLLAGNANPSGHLVDTWCYDATSAPAYANFNAYDYANSGNGDKRWYDEIFGMIDGDKKYTVYQEGIYLGYRYYETRYEDFVLGQGNAGNYDYASTVVYPFGYGLSYTDFAWTDYTAEYDAETDAFAVTLTVTNTGTVAGKDVVEIYAQSPYTDYDKTNGIEKASVELCSYQKTAELAPGTSETVHISVPRSELTCYDAKGAGTYILEAGDYYLTAARNAHEAINNILLAKGCSSLMLPGNGSTDTVTLWQNPATDKTTYAVSDSTGETIENQFDSADLNYYQENTVQYLTRSDWVDTMPTPQTGISATEEMLTALDIRSTWEKTDDSAAMPTMGADNGRKLIEFKGVSYDDPAWEELLDELTFDDMALLVGQGYHNTQALASIAKPATLEDNGPQGFTTTLTSIDGTSSKSTLCAYTDENVMAATWNDDLIEQMGVCIGNDLLSYNACAIYAPAMNLHRTAFGGRNFEYYSEDPFLSGKMGAAECRGIQSKGAFVYIKHFAMNDAEIYPRSLSTFATEQTIRELYLKPFETAIKEGDAKCVMVAFNRIGCTWCGAHTGLMTDVLQKEWGLDGYAMTDFSGSVLFKYLSDDVVHGLMAGTSQWDCSSDHWTKELNEYKNNAAVVTAMREASKKTLYTVVNSSAMNGIGPDTEVVIHHPWWKNAIFAVDAVLGVILVILLVRLIAACVSEHKSKKELAAAQTKD